MDDVTTKQQEYINKTTLRWVEYQNKPVQTVVGWGLNDKY